MASTRFRWRPYPAELTETYKARVVAELKARKTKRHLYPAELDKKLKCIVGCGEELRSDDLVYSPTINPGQDNAIAAHVRCVNGFAASQKAALKDEAKAAKLKDEESKGLLPVPSELDIDSQLQKIIDAAMREGYERGFKAGQQSVNTKLAEKLASLKNDLELGH